MQEDRKVKGQGQGRRFIVVVCFSFLYGVSMEGLHS